MDRRGFLKGVVGGVSATGLLVTASDADILAFANPIGAPVAVTPEPKARNYGDPGALIGSMVFDSDGRALGVIDRIDVNRRLEGVTFSWDDGKHLMGGITRVELHVVCHGPVRIGTL